MGTERPRARGERVGQPVQRRLARGDGQGLLGGGARGRGTTPDGVFRAGWADGTERWGSPGGRGAACNKMRARGSGISELAAGEGTCDEMWGSVGGGPGSCV